MPPVAHSPRSGVGGSSPSERPVFFGHLDKGDEYVVGAKVEGISESGRNLGVEFLFDVDAPACIQHDLDDDEIFGARNAAICRMGEQKFLIDGLHDLKTVIHRYVGLVDQGFVDAFGGRPHVLLRLARAEEQFD